MITLPIPVHKCKLEFDGAAVYVAVEVQIGFPLNCFWGVDQPVSVQHMNEIIGEGITICLTCDEVDALQRRIVAAIESDLCSVTSDEIEVDVETFPYSMHHSSEALSGTSFEGTLPGAFPL